MLTLHLKVHLFVVVGLQFSDMPAMNTALYFNQQHMVILATR